ncbi:MAG: hypothetical protein JOY58_01365, partial [Solirubrobacterales bacterium]|nr:hypothetical protein [Solirubrobacterales bacterium]
MPELPDVEGFRRYLARHAAGHRIVRVEVPDRELIRNSSASALSRAIIGQRFAHPLRHGKWLIAPVGELELLLHFGMTGFLRWSSARDRAHGDSSHRQPRDPRGKPRNPYDRVIFDCDDGELRYNNMRRFGGIWLARDERERAAVTGPLGPDAAALERRTFNELLSKRRGSIKAALMDQRLIAGIGNLLSDEILWRARVHPATPVASLGPNRRGRLFEALDATV